MRYPQRTRPKLLGGELTRVEQPPRRHRHLHAMLGVEAVQQVEGVEFVAGAVRVVFDFGAVAIEGDVFDPCDGGLARLGVVAAFPVGVVEAPDGEGEAVVGAVEVEGCEQVAAGVVAHRGPPGCRLLMS
ncbi:hypothetical protein RHRU231_450121 [Rhodococcus ruber]|uniref:Uncharacterized protein n=1 Tax=Rhodococcus ruber TaxID=1830 RepID=A0A098BJM7_9NOCA|nr:hypothetical protein RHRU231_450121 [Rhodococcus ruber]